MGKNKSKKLAQKAANATIVSTDSSSSPVASTSPQNVLLPSSKDAETSSATIQSIPYSSEGPTLPIIGGDISSGGSPAIAPKLGGRAVKKRKLANGDAQETPVPGKEVERNDERIQRTDLEPLYEPWTLLPPALRKSFEAKPNRKPFGEDAISIVFTKNQNIKAGINRLKAHLGADPPSGSMPSSIQDTLGKDRSMIAVSAQGEATTKLVGIMEMLKRIVGSSGEEEGGERVVEEWYMYTSLSSRVVERQKKRKGNNKGDTDDGEEEEGFETLGQIHKRDQEEGRSKKTVPVLTVWMSKRRIPEFRDVFGEQTFHVLVSRGQG